MKDLKLRLKQIQEKLNELNDSNATQEEAILVVNDLLYEIKTNIKPEIDEWHDCIIEKDGYVEPPKNYRDLLNEYKKTMRMIQKTKDEFDFPDPEAERRMMYPDGVNDPDFE